MNYLNMVQELNETLLVAVIVMSGLPLRATEYEPLQVLNRKHGAINLLRHVYWDEKIDGFVFYSEYSKKGVDKTTHYLLGVAAEVFAMYHVIIKPVASYIAYLTSNPPPNRNGMATYKRQMNQFFAVTCLNDYLFVGVYGIHFTAEHIRNTFLIVVVRIYGSRLTLGMWRHVRIIDI